MTIDSETRRDLRRLAHHLKPVVIVAERGLEESVLHEIERALADHELIKVKLAIDDREARASTASEICSFTGADKVADIGKISVLFRPNPSAKPQLSNLQRPISTSKPSALSTAPVKRAPAAKRKVTAKRKPTSRSGPAVSSAGSSGNARSGGARAGGPRSGGARAGSPRPSGPTRRKPTQTR